MFSISLQQRSLTDAQRETLHQMWLRCMRRIILSTTLAGSGHPGGSMSSLHLVLMLYCTLEHRPDDPCWPERDRVVVSMGHISPCVYSVLAEFGYTPEDNFILEFRQAGSSYAGHVECCVPGVEWNTGNLGQGLSVGAGMALGLKLRGSRASTFVLMGDGEQQKGQIAEARRFAVKYELNDLCCVIDRNHLQIGGDTDSVMPQEIEAEYAASQWNTIRVGDGHNFDEIFQALRQVRSSEVDDPRYPSVIIAETVMGKGVSFMENKAKYHGSTLKDDEAAAALKELGLDNPLPALRGRRKTLRVFHAPFCPALDHSKIEPGQPKTYAMDVTTDCRSAYGAALEDLARLNNAGEHPRILGFSCDLEGSVKMDAFHRQNPGCFFEGGIQEHNTATLAGAASKEGFVVFFSTFGVFGVSEVYNQQRLNDINHTHLKLVCTHLGLDVGEDGQTHQCIDYIGLVQNLYGFSIFMPADPNQTDRIVRHVASHPGNHFVGMGRSKMGIISDESGKPFFGGDYRFVPGKADWLRRGGHGAILSCGPVVHNALRAREELAARHGIEMSVLNLASIKPLDADAVLEAAGTGFVITAEDHHIDTGLGARVSTVLAEAGAACRMIRLGVRSYGLSGHPEVLYRLEGLDAEGIVKTVLQARSDGRIRG